MSIQFLLKISDHTRKLSVKNLSVINSNLSQFILVHENHKIFQIYPKKFYFKVLGKFVKIEYNVLNNKYFNNYKKIEIEISIKGITLRVNISELYDLMTQLVLEGNHSTLCIRNIPFSY